MLCSFGTSTEASAPAVLSLTRGAWAATGYSSRYPRRAWAATGIVVRWSVCLFVMCESTHLHAMALRLQHG